MGACLSCVGIRKDPDDAESQRLLYEDPYSHPNQNQNYGSWNQSSHIQSQNLMSQDEVRREQQALNNITRWASDQIVEIFPHRTNLSTLNMGASTTSANNGNGLDSPHLNGNGNGTGNGNGGMSASAHQDILLSMIPGDKSKRSIRIYAASRPSSRAADRSSIRSKASATMINGGFKGGDGANESGKGKGVFVKLNVDLP